jgi:hypothetical protein
MADVFFSLSQADRRDALEVAAARSGRAVHLLEKDVWVVWKLNALFESDFSGHLVFKGGTSLSKAYQAIGRFSEDVDLTYDIRAIAPDLAPDSAHALPSTRSQEQRWTKTIRERLDVWVSETVTPLLTGRLVESGLSGRAKAEADTVLVTYEALTSGSGYVRPVVLLEFGARSIGEPSEKRPIRCDAATHLPDVRFPEASPNVMRPERTFWERRRRFTSSAEAVDFVVRNASLGTGMTWPVSTRLRTSRRLSRIGTWRDTWQHTRRCSFAKETDTARSSITLRRSWVRCTWRRTARQRNSSPLTTREWSTTGYSLKSRQSLRSSSLDVEPFKIGRTT